MEDGTTSMFSSTTKTRNEISTDDYEQIQKFFPKLIGQVTDICELGVVQSLTNQWFVVNWSNTNEILDLDNFVCN